MRQLILLGLIIAVLAFALMFIKHGDFARAERTANIAVVLSPIAFGALALNMGSPIRLREPERQGGGLRRM